MFYLSDQFYREINFEPFSELARVNFHSSPVTENFLDFHTVTFDISMTEKPIKQIMFFRHRRLDIL